MVVNTLLHPFSIYYYIPIGRAFQFQIFDFTQTLT